jgi:transposase-like protein
LIEGRLSTGSAKNELVKLATRLIVEEALEAEAADAVGRNYYEHGAQPGQGYRNGYRTGRQKTAKGLMEYSAPEIASREEPFRSPIRAHRRIWQSKCWHADYRVRDIEDAFKDESGRLPLSRTAVSQLGERLWEGYQVFAKRELNEYESPICSLTALPNGCVLVPSASLCWRRGVTRWKGAACYCI